MPKRESRQEIDAILHKYKSEETTSEGGSWFAYLLVGAVVAALPIYLYLTPIFGIAPLDTEKDAVTLGIVTFVATAALSASYNKIATQAGRRLARKRQGEKAGAGGYGFEAMTWALFISNAIFLCGFVFAAFYLLKGMLDDTAFHYGASVAFAAGCSLFNAFLL